MAKFSVNFNLLWIVSVLWCVGLVRAQGDPSCYGSGSIATSVIVTFILTVLVLYLIYFLWQKYRKNKQGKHLVLETDPEKGKNEYAFDNPGFKDTTLTPAGKALDKNNKLESGKTKWTQWSPLSALTLKNEKRKTQDDSGVGDKEIKIVSLRSHDFTGLGFNICGSMRDGIFIKDILHRGPASESGKLNAGDRIKSITINFEHMVYEDALTILSYASPYEVVIEAQGGKLNSNSTAKSAQPAHPLYRSASSTDLIQIGKSAKKLLFQSDDASANSRYSSLQKTHSTATTLERNQSNSPKPGSQKPDRLSKSPKSQNLSPQQLKTQLEQRIIEDHKQNLKNKNEKIDEKPVKAEAEIQKTENRFQKFGIRVLPMEMKPDQTKEQKSPKSAELSQNDNNINLERHLDNKMPAAEPETKVVIMSIDEVDKSKVIVVAPQVKKREKINKSNENLKDIDSEPDTFIRQNSAFGSGIKRDKDGIPQEIPTHMLNAAVAARKNRKSSIEITEDADAVKSPKKQKGRAPPPPEERQSSPTSFHSMDDSIPKLNNTSTFDEIYTADDQDLSAKMSDSLIAQTSILNKTDDSMEKLPTENESFNGKVKDDSQEYNSDSDMETDNQSSVNTIELNASDITIHQAEEEEELQNRRTASTGDLTKIQKGKGNSGTLERAQSLDITDASIPTLTKKRKGGKIEDTFDVKTDPDDNLYGKALIHKEPRLSLALDGLNTFQRSRLKKSTEWGNLEDAILSLDKDVNEEPKTFNFGAKSAEFDALVNKINEIKQETAEIQPKIEEKERIIHETLEKIERTLEPPPKIERTLEHPPKIEMTLEHPSKIERILDVPSKIERILEPPSNIERTIELPSKIELNLEHPSKIEMNLEHPSKIEMNLEHPTNIERILDTPSKIERILEPPTKMEKTPELPTKLERTLGVPSKIEMTLESPSIVERTLESPSRIERILELSPKIQITQEPPPKISDKIDKTVEVNLKLFNKPDETTEVTTTTITEIEKSEPVDQEFISKTVEMITKPVISYKGISLKTDEKDSGETTKVKNQIWPTFQREKPRDTEITATISTKIVPEVTNNSHDKVESIHVTSIPKLTTLTTLNKPSSPKLEENVNIRVTNDNALGAIAKTPSPVHDTPQKASQKHVPSTVTIHAPVPIDLSHNFLLSEKYDSNHDPYYHLLNKLYDINVSDDIKVSRHSLGSLERPKSTDIKSKTQNTISYADGNVSNIIINNKNVETGEQLTSHIPRLAISVNSKKPDIKLNDTKTEIDINASTMSELYTTALDETLIHENQDDDEKDSILSYEKVVITTPDLIQNVTIAEAINDVNNQVTIEGPTSLTFEITGDPIDMKETKYSGLTNHGLKFNGESITISSPTINNISNISDDSSGSDLSSKTVNVSNSTINITNTDKSPNKSNSSLTYITEIQVLTPNTNGKSNISEIEITPTTNSGNKNLEREFENYINNFESNIKNFESHIQNVSTIVNSETPANSLSQNAAGSEHVDVEKELHKIHEIAEEQLKKLPEMRFTTSSYESPKIPEKRSAQIDQIRSNFERNITERSPPKSTKIDTSKSRIPIATTKTPPTSPERRDSKTYDLEVDKEIVEIMSSSVHSTPIPSNLRYPKIPNKNVTVTSIRNNSKIPSGLPNRPPVPPRKSESMDSDNTVHVSTNGGSETSFKQWVFNPADGSVTNITVSESKLERK